MKFGEKLTNLRKQKGLSQEELGEKLDVTRQTISKWELDQTSPDAGKLTEIAKFFNVGVNELTSEEEIRIENTNENANTGTQKTPTGIIVLIIVLVIFLVGIVFFVTQFIIGKSILGSFGKMFNKNSKMIDQAGGILETVKNIAEEEMKKDDEFENKMNEAAEDINKTIQEQEEEDKEFEQYKSQVIDDINKTKQEIEEKSQNASQDFEKAKQEIQEKQSQIMEDINKVKQKFN